MPITYGDTLLGILNVESQRENAYLEDEILILKTLADILATALHNVFVFQKLEHQSITDPLTGIKTRRFFNEALQSEYKRAMRSGRPFSLVIIDLDKFKEVNDSMGHLEGDLVLARIGRLLDLFPRDMHAALNTVDVPLNALTEKELCPGSAALEKLNASLR